MEDMEPVPFDDDTALEGDNVSEGAGTNDELDVMPRKIKSMMMSMKLLKNKEMNRKLNQSTVVAYVLSSFQSILLRRCQPISLMNKTNSTIQSTKLLDLG